MPEDMPDKTTKRGISSNLDSEEGNKKIPKLTLQSSSPARALKKEPPEEDDAVFVGVYTPPRAKTTGKFNLSPVQEAAIDVRKNRDVAHGEYLKASDRSKVMFKKLNAARLGYKSSIAHEQKLKNRVAGYDQTIAVMQQMDTFFHENKTKGTRLFAPQLNTPTKFEPGEFSADDAEMAEHEMMLATPVVKSKPADEEKAKAGMKTTGESDEVDDSKN